MASDGLQPPAAKRIKVSLEPPQLQTDADGKPRPDYVLLDVSPSNEPVYEPVEDADTQFETKLHRIWAERGDFSLVSVEGLLKEEEEKAEEKEEEEGKEEAEEKEEGREEEEKKMTPEELFELKQNVLGTLHAARNEFAVGLDLVNLLLSSTARAPSAEVQLPLPRGSITCTAISKPAPSAAVRARDLQLVLGAKEASLRAAADVFARAAERTEKVVERGVNYWRDALELREKNWNIVPAAGVGAGRALGLGAAAERATAKDFVVTYGLDEAPFERTRSAFAWIPTSSSASTQPLATPPRRSRRLRVSLSYESGERGENAVRELEDPDGKNAVLRNAQLEAFEEELFAELLNEAKHLPAVQSSFEEEIVVDAGPGAQLTLSLIETPDLPSPSSPLPLSPLCTLIHQSLHLLLLRSYRFRASRRALRHPPMLQPVLELLQYRAFAARLRATLEETARVLRRASVGARWGMRDVLESGREVVQALAKSEGSLQLGGSAYLAITDAHSVRLSIASPTRLVMLLPYAMQPVSDVPQLHALVGLEIESALLELLHSKLAPPFAGMTWVIDQLERRLVGRSKDGLIHFTPKSDGRSLSVSCEVVQREGKGEVKGRRSVYEAKEEGALGLLDWARERVEEFGGEA